MRFEWDPDKEVRNLRKHGVSLEEASTVFGDALAATILDAKHSELEVRFITMGMSSGSRLLVVSHTDLKRASGLSARGGNHKGKKAL